MSLGSWNRGGMQGPESGWQLMRLCPPDHVLEHKGRELVHASSLDAINVWHVEMMEDREGIISRCS